MSTFMIQHHPERKRGLVCRAVKLFDLVPTDAICLAEKLGLAPEFLAGHSGDFSTEFSAEIAITAPKLNDTNGVGSEFNVHLQYLLCAYDQKGSKLRDEADISERMFNHILKDKHVTKESALALLIVMGLTLERIYTVLSKAGFVLSTAIPSDVVIRHLLEHEAKSHTGVRRLRLINDTLESLGLPLLRTGR